MKIAIIPARGGSKRIKNKNIINLYGKPLIAHTIKNLIDSKLFDLVIVSTDSVKIQKISIKAGAKIFFKRPKNLSNDFVGTFDVVNHSINYLINKGMNPKYVCCVYPASIMIKPKDINNSFDKIKSKKWNFVFSITDFGHPPQRGFGLKNNRISILDKNFFAKRTQDIKKIYHDAGQFYWGKTQSWLKNESLFTKKSFGYFLPRYSALDIDDIEDLNALKKIFYFTRKLK
jgi:pseudaminic acid cytidylyltransferase